jgi:hypothetical protein
MGGRADLGIGEGAGLGARDSLLAAESAPFHFVDIAESAGIRAPTWYGRPDKPHLLESTGTGLALFDYDGDEDLDLFVVNGWRLQGTAVAERGTNFLYRNRGDGTFEDVSAEAGLGDDGFGAGVAASDIDGDGDLDLFVTNFGPDLLYRNNGDGTFTVLPEGPGVDGWSAAGVFFDADRDGDPDLYVTAYVESTLDEVLHAEPELYWLSTQVMRGPFGLEGLANRFFENLGDGSFRDATSEAGLDDVGLYYSLAAAALDLDGDLALDLYVANDSNPNYLYQNDGSGHFQEIGLWSGAAFDKEGLAQAGMGLATADVSGNGLPDIFVSNFHLDHSTLYFNLGDLFFEDVTTEVGLQEATYDALSWGSVLADFDLDGDVDLFIANGHIYPQADDPDTGTSYAQANQLFVNEDKRFIDVSEQSGPGLAVVESSRGVAAGDIDGDGDLDLAITNIDAPPTLLRNDTERRGVWLLVDAPGAALVSVEAGDKRWTRHYVAGASYISVSDTRFHFGLGRVEQVDRLTVLWFDGTETVLENVGVNRIIEMGQPTHRDSR